jgi:hypothetical protein
VTRSALAGDLARLHTGAAGGWPALAARAPGADRCGAQPVRWVAGTGSAPTPPWPGGPKSGWRRPGAQRFPGRSAVTGPSCAACGSASSSRAATHERRRAGPGALRAPLKTLDLCTDTTAQVQALWVRYTRRGTTGHNPMGWLLPLTQYVEVVLFDLSGPRDHLGHVVGYVEVAAGKGVGRS